MTDIRDFSQWASDEGTDRVKIDSIAREHGKTAYLCKVVAVSEVKKEGRIMTTVDIEPLVTQLSTDSKPIPHDIIYNVVCKDFSAGDVAIIIKPKLDDVGIALICHDDISGVKRGLGSKSPPISLRHNSHSDSVYLGAVMKKEPKTYIIIEDDKVTVRSKSVLFESESVKITGNLLVMGDIESKGTVKAAVDMVIGIFRFLTHGHGGVMSGSSKTTPPVP
jgi:hypothetical protein